MPIVAKRIFLTKGVGVHKEKLASFELALRKAGIAPYNIVKVSSILPPRVKMITREGAKELMLPGQILFTVLSSCESNEPNRLMSSSIGIAIPSDPNAYGYLSEHHAFGQTERVAGDYAEDLAATMLASTLGLPFDPDHAWDKRHEIFHMGKKIVRTRSITQSARVDKDGRWTTVLAAAVLLD